LSAASVSRCDASRSLPSARRIIFATSLIWIKMRRAAFCYLGGARKPTSQ
jgi:hypothetical protein